MRTMPLDDELALYRATVRAGTRGRWLAIGVLSLGFSARLNLRFGARAVLVPGMVLVALGLAWLTRAPVDGGYAVDVLPAMLLLGLGAGIAFNPVLLAATSDVAPEEAGLASGVVNTAFMMGGALGLAVLASLAASRTDSLLSSGDDSLGALVGGYHAAFLVGALFAAVAAVLAAVLLRVRASEQEPEAEPFAEAA